MRTAYLDTNVFVSSYKPDDLYHREASMIIKALESGEIRGQTSVLTILEAAAVASRTIRIHKGDDEKEIRQMAVSKIIRNLSRLGLTFIHVLGDSSAPIDEIEVEMPAIFHQALLLASTIGLRSFDLVHLAAAKYASLMDSDKGSFITGDMDFLSGKRELSKVIGMPVLSPKEYVEGLGMAK